MKPGCKDYFSEIASLKGLRAGWDRVRKNGGAPGNDSISIEMFNRSLDASLEELSGALFAGTYKPCPLRALQIPKNNGKLRKLKIPAVGDRVVQSSTQMILARHIDPQLSPASYGYRPGRGVKAAVTKSRNYINHGMVHVLDADIENFFDNVRHDILTQELAIWIPDIRLLRLLQTWLEQFSEEGAGIAQGSPVSPFFANLYLHPLDKLLIADGFRVVRYADDFLVFAKNRQALQRVNERTQQIMRQRHLTLSAEKTYLRGPGDRFTFLGEALSIPGSAQSNSGDQEPKPPRFSAWLRSIFPRGAGR